MTLCTSIPKVGQTEMVSSAVRYEREMCAEKFATGPTVLSVLDRPNHRPRTFAADRPGGPVRERGQDGLRGGRTQDRPGEDRRDSRISFARCRKGKEESR